MRELADKGGLKLNATEITLSQEIRRGLSETEVSLQCLSLFLKRARTKKLNLERFSLSRLIIS
jgi:hypothetical protein